MNIIAIDGYSGTGKGTTSIGVAKELGRTYLDTGAMYRAVGLYAIRNDQLENNETQMAEMMKNIHINFKAASKYAGHFQDTYLNGENVEHLIRTSEIGTKMTPIVVSPTVRKILAQMQADFGKSRNLIADGRDIGTVVFPTAPLKIFMICDIEIRAKRRYNQLSSKGLPTDIETIKTEMKYRDYRDCLGPDAIGVQAEDARILDTTHMTIEQQIQQVVDRWEKCNSSL